ncbi:MalY/PatB family protein [Sporomusa acidovorans]|uniref:cysteine-S-conjugate beta-lyase n=1 Tax=Sporomusa acidovorans (strain ATCC 49682 / DSM 3132 / Mol) TaxID=1123286 RepID=A0ABZ3IWQ6_SPOA4|nr:PatB family C-S lyase [Sporomusa acidovorans]OZC22030.1 cystathionine beta-lyase PatB [Sporomusa acidovorans DSM 3132]SDF69929.1 cystathione beta-lyase [Sporomusa acidovorans]
MKYNFDEIIDRKDTNCMSTDGFRSYIFHDEAGIMKFPYQDDEFVRMWIADMEFATPKFILDAMKARLDRRILGYTKIFDPGYYQAFKKWTEEHYGWSCKKEHIVTSAGIVAALYILVDFVTKPDEKVLILTPSYAYFKYAADYNKRELVCSDLINENGYYTINFEDFAQKAADAKTTLCIFCNPHNPTGRVWSEEELKKVSEICRENNLWLISDEIHCDLIRKNLRHIPMAKVMTDYDKLITCMAPSKTFNMAGTTLSNIVIRNDKLRAYWQERYYLTENPLSIAGVQAAYAHGSEWLEELKGYLDGNFAYVRDFLAEHLPKAKFRLPEATYLGWVDVGAYLPAEDNLPKFFADKAGVLLEGGNMFVQNSDGYIRLNVACPRSILKNGLNRIKEALLKYGN